ncbi:MAG: 30S ribosome-binding factor RbfA [Candidatus Accumulibacter sp.]|nr:30S ribosome-binding factor RbfA [Accumulibacter sp.]
MTANKGFARRDRISEQIRRELAELIRSELKDPRVGMISITDVEISADYAHAKVFFSHLSGREHVDPVLDGLQQAAGFLRRELGRRISIHSTPQLHFVFDESLERGAELSRLIDEAVSISGASDPAENA